MSWKIIVSIVVAAIATVAMERQGLNTYGPLTTLVVGTIIFWFLLWTLEKRAKR